MKVTVEFTDGSYLTVEDFGKFCIYEEINRDFQGNLKDTLNQLPKHKKVAFVRQMLKLNKKYIGGNKYVNNNGSDKIIEWSRQTRV